jgi:hypothetical protein
MGLQAASSKSRPIQVEARGLIRDRITQSRQPSRRALWRGTRCDGAPQLRLGAHPPAPALQAVQGRNQTSRGRATTAVAPAAPPPPPLVGRERRAASERVSTASRLSTHRFGEPGGATAATPSRRAPARLSRLSQRPAVAVADAGAVVPGSGRRSPAASRVLPRPPPVSRPARPAMVTLQGGDGDASGRRW